MTVYDIISKDLDKATADSIAASLKLKGYTASVSANVVGTPTAPSAPTSTSLTIGDLVKIQKDAPVYGTSKPFSSWVYNKELYVRAISGDRITVSIYQSGAITGQVDKKYLTKV